MRALPAHFLANIATERSYLSRKRRFIAANAQSRLWHNVTGENPICWLVEKLVLRTRSATLRRKRHFLNLAALLPLFPARIRAGHFALQLQSAGQTSVRPLLSCSPGFRQAVGSKPEDGRGGNDMKSTRSAITTIV